VTEAQPREPPGARAHCDPSPAGRQGPASAGVLIAAGCRPVGAPAIGDPYRSVAVASLRHRPRPRRQAAVRSRQRHCHRSIHPLGRSGCRNRHRSNRGPVADCPSPAKARCMERSMPPSAGGVSAHIAHHVPGHGIERGCSGLSPAATRAPAGSKPSCERSSLWNRLSSLLRTAKKGCATTKHLPDVARSSFSFSVASSLPAASPCCVSLHRRCLASAGSASLPGSSSAAAASLQKNCNCSNGTSPMYGKARPKLRPGFTKRPIASEGRPPPRACREPRVGTTYFLRLLFLAFFLAICLRAFFLAVFLPLGRRFWRWHSSSTATCRRTSAGWTISLPLPVSTS